MDKNMGELLVAALLAVLVTAIVLSGHSNDVGVSSVIGFLGIAITAIFTHAIADKAATRASNGLTKKVEDAIDRTQENNHDR